MAVTRFREPVSGFTHLVGAVLAVMGLVWLVTLTRDDFVRMVTVAVFGVSMVLVYVASTVMHLYNGSERVLWWLNRLDHAAIYVFIAGTYTPLCYHLLTGHWRIVLLAAVWIMAILGVISKLTVGWGGHLSTLFYVVMGWTGVLSIPAAVGVVDPGALALIALGGVVYTVGAVVFALRRPNLHRCFGYHELWHLFVMGGSAAHFAAVLVYVALA